MVSGVGLYIEGDRRLRPGFGKFFERLRDLARAKQIGWDVILCGSRNSALDSFKTALVQHPNAFNVLLVDSEGPVAKTPWEHLRERDGWHPPPEADEESCHLMVQTMEAWFLADPEALKGFYKQNFNENPLPRRDNVEEVEKPAIRDALGQAISRTSKPNYEKVVHGVGILMRLTETTVRKRAPHCERLFRAIEAKIIGPSG